MHISPKEKHCLVEMLLAAETASDINWSLKCFDELATEISTSSNNSKLVTTFGITPQTDVRTRELIKTRRYFYLTSLLYTLHNTLARIYLV